MAIKKVDVFLLRAQKFCSEESVELLLSSRSVQVLIRLSPSMRAGIPKSSDACSRPELIDKYSGYPGVDVDRIEEVDLFGATVLSVTLCHPSSTVRLMH